MGEQWKVRTEKLLIDGCYSKTSIYIAEDREEPNDIFDYIKIAEVFGEDEEVKKVIAKRIELSVNALVDWPNDDLEAINEQGGISLKVTTDFEKEHERLKAQNKELKVALSKATDILTLNDYQSVYFKDILDKIERGQL